MLSDLRLTEYDRYLFGQGTHYSIFNKLGAHPAVSDGLKGVYFAVWAPNARYVSVIGEFNDWSPTSAPMSRVDGSGFFEAFLPEARPGDAYKYHIEGADGIIRDKADPYGFRTQKLPGTASRVCDISEYNWQDRDWMQARAACDVNSQPLSIYEMHLASWQRPDEDRLYTYTELAPLVIEYVKEMGYTHVELIGIAEYPYDPSWGYQVTGYYAPTSRYGQPTDFMAFVDELHRAGIGVILDWVPAHFPKDAQGLATFDGTCLYEYADPRKGSRAEWGTMVFDYGRPEVRNFLIANALFWAERYHIDGLRVDAVASMLYLDFGREPGAWVPNINGGSENLEAVEFLKHLNSILHGLHPDVMTIAEESTSWPGVTASLEDGGLGFNYKWNMGWMHDFLEYIGTDPLFRRGCHDYMTFSITYASSERYILPLSHDEVVHLKKSMAEKPPGDEGQRLACLKAAYAYFMGHPGRKLLFMGQEFGQHREWSEARELDWYLLREPVHKGLKDYVRGLLHMYRTYPALYADDSGYPAFEWIDCDDAENSTYSFIRHGRPGEKSLVFVMHFTPTELPDYRIGVPTAGDYKLIFSDVFVPGSDVPTYAETVAWDRFEHSIPCPLDSYGVRVYEYDEPGDEASEV